MSATFDGCGTRAATVERSAQSKDHSTRSGENFAFHGEILTESKRGPGLMASDRVVICEHCQKPAQFVSGRVIYRSRQDLFDRRFWYCIGCNAYVGCHDGTDIPLGGLAKPETRSARILAHASFDRLWRERIFRRSDAYTWLAEQLGIDKDSCHIGMFDVATCNKVVTICDEKWEKEKNAKAV